MTQDRHAEAVVKNILLLNETICWQSAGVPFKLLEKDSRSGLIRRWTGCGIGCALMIAACVINVGSGLGFLLLILALLALLMFAPVFEMRRMREYRYFLTNHRAILVTNYDEVHSLNLEYADDVQVLRGQTGGNCLALGSAMMRDLNQVLRWLTCHPRTNLADSEHGVGMVFCSIGNAGEAMDCLRQGCAC